MSTAFLDTNVLLYAALQPDARSERARGLLAQGGVISVQALNEFAAVARRELQRPWPEIHRALTAIRTLCLPERPLDLATHEAALGLAERYGSAFYDALIAALVHGAGASSSAAAKTSQSWACLSSIMLPAAIASQRPATGSRTGQPTRLAYDGAVT